MSLPKWRKEEIIKRFQLHENDTGSPEVQIAIMTERIKKIMDHLKVHKKDYHTRRGLMKLLGKRRALLNYLKRISPERYERLIKALGLRK